MNPLKRVLDRFRPSPLPVRRVVPPHKHDFTGAWLPTDMGRKEVTCCRVEGCYEASTRATAEPGQYREVAEVAERLVGHLEQKTFAALSPDYFRDFASIADAAKKLSESPEKPPRKPRR